MRIANSHTSRNALVMIAAAAISLQPGCRSVHSFPGQRLDVPTAADGQLEDFSKLITSHLFENGMMVGVGNDEKNLYVFFTPDIRRGQRFPGRARLILWIDEKGGKARKLGLEHVSGPTGRETPPAGGQPGNGKNLESRPMENPGPPSAGQAQELLKVVDRAGGKEMYIALDGSQGPAVRLADDWGDFTYQLRIPFQGTGDWPGLDLRPGQVIGIGLLWKIERLSVHGKDGAPSGRPRGGHGGGGPGMGGAPPDMEEGPGGGMPGATPATQRKVWLKTVIANQ